MFLKHLVGGLLLSSVIASAWTIDGHVLDSKGSPIANVTIGSFNYQGISGTTDTEGFFSLSNEESQSLNGDFAFRKLEVLYNGSELDIVNKTGNVFKITLIDILGKVLFQKEFYASNERLGLHKYSHQKMLILRVSGEAFAEKYILSNNKAKHMLMKDGDLKAMLSFSKDGYNMRSYTMQNDVEKNVNIVLYKIDETVPQSSDALLSSSEGVSSAVASSSSFAVSSNSDVKPASKLEPGDHHMYVGQRLFIVHVPNTYTGEEPVPLLVDYHPMGGSAISWLSGSPYKQTTDQEGVITIYPDGDSQVWNVGSCCTSVDDEAFTRSFVAEVKKIAYIDSKRIYATGFSMGGGMSQFAACNMADIFAAIAPAGFDLAMENVDKCKPSRPISIISFRGTNDGVVTYPGHAQPMYPDRPLTFLGAQDNHKKWAEINKCVGVPTNDVNGCSTYENCDAGTKVSLCTNKNNASCDGTGHDAGCPRIGWPFLKQFVMP